MAGAPSTYRNAMTTKLRLYRRDLGKLQREMKTPESGFGVPARPKDGGYGVYSSQNEHSVSLDCRSTGLQDE